MSTHDESLPIRSPSGKRTARATSRTVGGSEGPGPSASSSAESAILGLQRLAGNASVARMLAPDAADEAPGRSPVLDVVGNGGTPLEPAVRAAMEGRLGADFSDVRIHTDDEATASARAVGAEAYTVGADVVVRSDRWSPDTPDGQRTLAHELAHVIQQRAGPVATTPAGGGIGLSDPGDAFERAADQVARAATAASPAASPGGSSTQRQSEGEEEVQSLSAQRRQPG
jgi:hypothetical protein